MDIANDMDYINDDPMHMCFRPAVITRNSMYQSNEPKYITFGILVHTSDSLLMHNEPLLMHNSK
ncbi:hypothetical protein [Sphingobacterium haloxyli]|uniref:hypothetical protein n=1 Tax=Sphingobacterium haloxyli TaxID=2100533 RepID=UPI001056ED32|nr:hypothetical protein [Sphingobacterium haloxyli]